MPEDALDILDAHGICAADLVAAAIRGRDPMLADILAAQAEWLRQGSAETLRAAANLLETVTTPERREAYRPELHLGGVFRDNLTLLGEGDDLFAWLCDDDIVSLADGGDFDPFSHSSPWELNTDADAALRALLQSDDRQRLRGIRLLVFEGTARIRRTLQDYGASHLVTHLELRLQRARDEGALADVFPDLLGLFCEATDFTRLLAKELTNLRSLVVSGPVDPHAVVRRAKRAPVLRHLGLFTAGWTADELGALLGSDVPERLSSLEIFCVHDAREFPFKVFADAAGAWAHLRFVGLPGHGVPPKVRELFGKHPQVTFVRHDRRQTLALDFETRGWAKTAR